MLNHFWGPRRIEENLCREVIRIRIEDCLTVARQPRLGCETGRQVKWQGPVIAKACRTFRIEHKFYECV